MSGLVSAVFGGGDNGAAEARARQAEQDKKIEAREAKVKRQESALKGLLGGGSGKSVLGFSGEDDGKGTTFGK